MLVSKSAEFASGSKIVGENWGEMELFRRVRVLSVGYLNCYRTHRNSL